MTDGERDRVIEGVRRALVLDSQRNRT